MRMGRGVPAGASNPVEFSGLLKSGNVSASAGTSGNWGARCGVATATATSFPSLTHGSAENSVTLE